MTNDPIYNHLRELGWRRKLTGAEEAQLRAWLAARPEAPESTTRARQPRSSHGKNAAGVPLWSTQAELNLADLPTGTHEFQGVPFEVLNPAQSPFRSCIVLSRQSPYPQSLTVPVGTKASSIYLLN